MAYRDVSVWLEDASMAIKKIKDYTKIILNYQQFVTNSMVIDAIERNLEIIAKVIKNAYRLEPTLPITNAKKIIGLRNIINHEYYNKK